MIKQAISGTIPSFPWAIGDLGRIEFPDAADVANGQDVLVVSVDPIAGKLVVAMDGSSRAWIKAAHVRRIGSVWDLGWPE